MAVPWTAEDEFLYAWGALKDVYLKEAVAAGDPAHSGGGATTFSGCTPGVLIPDGSALVRGDGVNFITLGDVNVAGGGTAVCNVQALEVGADGNTPIGVVLTLGSSIAGIQSDSIVSTAITGGADIETQDEFRARMLIIYQNPPQGGSGADYVKWALEVPGVTRAWCDPLTMGPGTVGVFFMMDDVRSAFNGFPQGTNGGATAETRTAAATGDQLVVADYIFPLRPVTALVYSMAPVANNVAFTIHGLPIPIRPAVELAIDDLFRENGSPGGTVNLLDIEAAIAAVPDASGAIVVIPNDNVVSAAGHLPVRGAMTYT